MPLDPWLWPALVMTAMLEWPIPPAPKGKLFDLDLHERPPVKRAPAPIIQHPVDYPVAPPAHVVVAQLTAEAGEICRRLAAGCLKWWRVVIAPKDRDDRRRLPRSPV